MKLRRGFKKEAEDYAADFRTELELPPDGRLDPFLLAYHLGVPVVPLSQLEGYGRNDDHQVGEDEFSAATIHDHTFKMIVHNDRHYPQRQNSNVMHEIAHILLGHPPHPPLTGDRCRNFDGILEAEAKELGFALLVPKLAALKVVESGLTIYQASIIYGVSKDLLQYRIDITDARGWAHNRRRRSRS